MTAVVFERRGIDYAVRFRYDPTLVDIVKTAVPSYARTWHPGPREWTVAADWADPLAAMIRQSGHAVIGLEDTTPPPKTTTNGDSGDWARAVFRRVGPGRSDIVYRALTKALHPDVGGDTQLMQELNAARREIQ